MQIDDKLILNLEDLSNLTLSGNEKNRMADDLQKILNGISKINELNTDGVQESNSYANVFRNDEVLPSFDRELILKNALVKNDEFFVAPKTVE